MLLTVTQEIKKHVLWIEDKFVINQSIKQDTICADLITQTHKYAPQLMDQTACSFLKDGI